MVGMPTNQEEHYETCLRVQKKVKTKNKGRADCINPKLRECKS